MRSTTSLPSATALDMASASTAGPTHPSAMLPPYRAWQILCQRTGCRVCRATFYRWISTGSVYSIRLGFRIFIPTPALEELIRLCLAGERI